MTEPKSANAPKQTHDDKLNEALALLTRLLAQKVVRDEFEKSK